MPAQRGEPELDVRPARPGDEMAVARVHVGSWQAAYRGLLPQDYDYLDGLRPEARAARYAFGEDAPGPVTIVAERAGAVVGFATIGRSRDADRPEDGELDALYILPDHLGRGVGRVLIADARRRLAGQGFEAALLWVLAGNDRARAFYVRDGWYADGAARTIEVGGSAAEVVRYRRSL